MALYTAFISACNDGTSCSTLWEYLQAANVCSSCTDIVCPALELNEASCPPCTALEVPRSECPPCPTISCPSLVCPDCFCDCPDVAAPVVDPGCPTLSDFSNLMRSSYFGDKELDGCEGLTPVVTGLTIVVLLLVVACLCLSAIIVHLLKSQRKVDPEAQTGNLIPRSRRRRSRKSRKGSLVIRDFLLLFA